jgi:hypothetical protein
LTDDAGTRSITRPLSAWLNTSIPCHARGSVRHSNN